MKETAALLIYETPHDQCLPPMVVSKETAENVMNNYFDTGGFKLFNINKRKIVTFMPYAVVIADVRTMIQSDENEISLIDVKNDKKYLYKFE